MNSSSKLISLGKVRIVKFREQLLVLMIEI